MLGSNYGPVNEQVAEVIRESGPVTGLFHEYELKLAEIINRYMPHIEMYRSLGSGTEAVMAAVRGARAFTGKKMVIKVGGAYHGWSDTMVYGLRVPGTLPDERQGHPVRRHRPHPGVLPARPGRSSSASSSRTGCAAARRP